MTEPSDRRPGPRYRSGAVARMAGIPVSTLRIWERRYQVVAPPLTASGQRLYADHDVQRLVLLKRLVGLGHAIGTIAALDLDALQQLSNARTATARTADAATAAPLGAVARTGSSALVIGHALAQRLSTGAPRSLAATAGIEVIAVCRDLADADVDADAGGLRAEWLLVHLSTLQAESAARVLALARRLGATRIVVLYGFAPEPAAQALRDGGAAARREPVADAELALLLAPLRPPAGLAPTGGPIPPRRFSDEALAQIAARSTTVACECPRHVAELVEQLASFEVYSAECASRNADDAALHADLNRVAATARALFEGALERIAIAEGFELPG